MSDFLANLDGLALAWLRIEGEEVTDQAGDEDRVSALGEQAALFLDGYFGKFDALFPADAQSCSTVVAPGGGEGMFFVEVGEISAFVVFDAVKAPKVAALWQGLVAE